MQPLTLKTNCLGFEVWDGDRLVTLYRATEELDRQESPKPCFHPIYTPGGTLVTEYRPKDHLWHTGLYYGWVHVGEANLWGGPWFLPETGKYEYVEGSHGRQAHESFDETAVDGDAARVVETVTFRDAADAVMATDRRQFVFRRLADGSGTVWDLTTAITAEIDPLVMGASRAAKYSGLELRMGPPFAPAEHRTSEGTRGHEAIMGSRARWCCAVGDAGGAVALLDHPSNPRRPVTWFTRKNLMGAGLLIPGDLTLAKGDTLDLRYRFLVLDADPDDAAVESQFADFAGT